MLSSRRGFSLIEMIVVIGIVGILISVILGVFGSSGESAQAAKCLSNMKNLANACYSVALADRDGHNFPLAFSSEHADVDSSRGVSNLRLKFTEYRGWISWDSRRKYPSQSSVKDSIRQISLYSEDFEEYTYALTNGSLWRYVSESAKTYVCPLHQKKFAEARWSYLMNSYIGGRSMNNLNKPAERILLFAEVPFQGPGDWIPEKGGSESDTDAVLLDDGEREHIGCNHKVGKYWMGHVAFADGHVEKIRAPADAANLKELTHWLCRGESVGSKGSMYEKLQ